jgi:hypothetical protein
VERGAMVRDETLKTSYPAKLTQRGIDLLAALGR